MGCCRLSQVEIQILILAGNNPSVSHTAATVSAAASVGASAFAEVSAGHPHPLHGGGNFLHKLLAEAMI